MEPLRRNPVMADLVDRYGDLSFEVADHEFERLVVSIISQSVSTDAAAAITARVRDLFDGPITPAALLAADESALVEAGLGETKTDYAGNAARAFQERDLTREGLADAPNETVVDALTAIRGVGIWTARMYLMFVLEREDVFPIGDLAVRRAMTDLYGDRTREEMVERASAWAPHRTTATLYLWKHYVGDDVDLDEILP